VIASLFTGTFCAFPVGSESIYQHLELSRAQRHSQDGASGYVASNYFQRRRQSMSSWCWTRFFGGSYVAFFFLQGRVAPSLLDFMTLPAKALIYVRLALDTFVRVGRMRGSLPDISRWDQPSRSENRDKRKAPRPSTYIQVALVSTTSSCTALRAGRSAWYSFTPLEAQQGAPPAVGAAAVRSPAAEATHSLAAVVGHIQAAVEERMAVRAAVLAGECRRSSPSEQ